MRVQQYYYYVFLAKIPRKTSTSSCFPSLFALHLGKQPQFRVKTVSAQFLHLTSLSSSFWSNGDIKEFFPLLHQILFLLPPLIHSREMEEEVNEASRLGREGERERTPQRDERKKPRWVGSWHFEMPPKMTSLALQVTFKFVRFVYHFELDF